MSGCYRENGRYGMVGWAQRGREGKMQPPLTHPSGQHLAEETAHKQSGITPMGRAATQRVCKARWFQRQRTHSAWRHQGRLHGSGPAEWYADRGEWGWCPGQTERQQSSAGLHGLGARLPGFTSHPCNLAALWTQASSLPLWVAMPSS